MQVVIRPQRKSFKSVSISQPYSRTYIIISGLVIVVKDPKICQAGMKFPKLHSYGPELWCLGCEIFGTFPILRQQVYLGHHWCIWMESLTRPTNDFQVVIRLFKKTTFSYFEVPCILISYNGAPLLKNLKPCWKILCAPQTWACLPPSKEWPSGPTGKSR